MCRLTCGGTVVGDSSGGRRGEGPGGVGDTGIGGERPIKGAGRLFIGVQQGVESFVQLIVVADLIVQECLAVAKVAPLDGRQEQGFDLLVIGRHAGVSPMKVFAHMA